MLVEGGFDWVTSGSRTGGLLDRGPPVGGRTIGVVVRRDPVAEPTDVTPEGFNARTTVHEYGGGAYVVHRGVVFFSNFADQRLYRQEPDGAPAADHARTPDGPLRYADGRVTPDGSLLICVRERHEGDGVVNELVGDPDGRLGRRDDRRGRHDFFSTPRVSPDGTKLAWLAWDLPWMPWDGSELWVADLEPDGVVSAPAPGRGRLAEESIFQPGWSPAGVAALRLGSHGLVEPLPRGRRRRAGDLPDGGRVRVAAVGVRRVARTRSSTTGASRASTTATARSTSPCSIPRTGELLDLDLPYDAIGAPYLAAEGQAIAFIGAGASMPAQVVLARLRAVDRRADGERERSRWTRVLSAPRAIEFPTEDGLDRARASSTRRRTRTSSAPAGERPPLIVMSHGGPTSAASTPTFDSGRSSGRAAGSRVVDVNYGGSTGYGRAYRERLERRLGRRRHRRLHQRRAVPGRRGRGRRRSGC